MRWRDWISKKDDGKEAMVPPALTPLHHSLLGYNAQVNGDAPVINLYSLPDLAYKPYMSSLRETEESWTGEYLNPIGSMRMVATHRLLDPQAQKDMLREFKKDVLPNTVLPWVEHTAQPENFIRASIRRANLELMTAAGHDTNSVTDLARHLRAALPGNAAVQSLTAPQALLDLQMDPENPVNLIRKLGSIATVPLEEQRQLNAVLRSHFQSSGKLEEYNAAMVKAPHNVAYSLGFDQAQRESFLPVPIGAPQPKDQPAGIRVDKDALQKATPKLIKHLKSSLPKQVTRNMALAVAHVERLDELLRTDNLSQPPLTPQAAEQELNAALAHVDEKTLAARLMRVALNNPDLKVTVLKGSNANGYWANFDLSQAKALKGYNVHGYARSSRDQILVSTGESVFSAAEAVVEETLHHAFKKLYPDNDRQLTYPPDYGKPPRRIKPPVPEGLEDFFVDDLFIRDARKTLFLEALRSDLNNLGRRVSTMRSDLGLPAAGYPPEKFHNEVVVKVIKMKALGNWSPGHERRYKHLSHFIDKVVGKDIADWEQAQAQHKRYDSRDHPVDADAIRAELPPVTTKQPFPFERAVERQKIGDTDYFMLNGDNFAVATMLDPKEFVTLRLGKAQQSTGEPDPEHITLTDSPRGTYAAIPVALLERLNKKLYENIKEMADTPLSAIVEPDYGPPPGKVDNWRELVRISKESKKAREQAQGEAWAQKITDPNPTTIAGPSLAV